MPTTAPAVRREAYSSAATFRAGLALLIGLILSGCAYQLGPTNQQVAGAQSISIEPFPNETLQPGLTDIVNSTVRRQVQRDGTF
ncbi:MAG: hypothetical protein RIS76_1190, partial [Verrucomicrobiota bacterium]